MLSPLENALQNNEMKAIQKSYVGHTYSLPYKHTFCFFNDRLVLEKLPTSSGNGFVLVVYYDEWKALHPRDTDNVDVSLMIEPQVFALSDFNNAMFCFISRLVSEDPRKRTGSMDTGQL